MTAEKKNMSTDELTDESVETTENSQKADKAEASDKTEEEVADEKHKHEDKKKRSKKENWEEAIHNLEEKIKELTDKHLRLQAEFDNYRRRTIREKAELIKSGGESVIASILPVIDDFERAVILMKDISDDDAGKQGTLLIYNKFKDFLKQNNVKVIDALNKDFDVDLHEALTKIPVGDDKLKGKIVEVIQNGYTLNDKVIRFAKVVVGE